MSIVAGAALAGDVPIYISLSFPIEERRIEPNSPGHRR
jgi:hypothetical protein